MAGFPKSRAQREIAEVNRRAARGEISAARARELAVRARAEQADRIRRAALDAAARGGA